MFNKTQLDAYSSIKAPDELLDKVKNIKPEKSKIYIIPLVSSLAACLILIFGVAAFMGFNGNSPAVYFAGTELTKESILTSDSSAGVYARSASVQIPVELDLSEKTEISVSNGLIVLENGETSDKVTLKGNAAFVWVLDLPNEETLSTMTLEGFSGTSLINLTQYTDGSYTAKIN